MVRRFSHRVEDGSEPVSIDELVSPLRYDILVRQRFLDRIATAGGDDDVRAAVAGPEGRAYFTWFSGIVVPRFLPDLTGDERAISAAFGYRVRRSVALAESFASSGYDSARPVVLQSGRRIKATTSGKRIERRLFAGDGCHRLALMRRKGITVLEPGSYRVEIAPVLTPLDNTAELIPLLGLDLRAYFEFLALAYAPGSGCDSEEGLRARVAAERPDRLAELDEVLAVDLPLLRSAACRSPGAAPGRSSG